MTDEYDLIGPAVVKSEAFTPRSTLKTCVVKRPYYFSVKRPLFLFFVTDLFAVESDGRHYPPGGGGRGDARKRCRGQRHVRKLMTVLPWRTCACVIRNNRPLFCFSWSITVFTPTLSPPQVSTEKCHQTSCPRYWLHSQAYLVHYVTFLQFTFLTNIVCLSPNVPFTLMYLLHYNNVLFPPVVFSSVPLGWPPHRMHAIK